MAFTCRKPVTVVFTPLIQLEIAESGSVSAWAGTATSRTGAEEDLRRGLNDTLRLPPEWAEIAARPGVPKKRMVTIRLDEDVVAVLRAMGAG